MLKLRLLKALLVCLALSACAARPTAEGDPAAASVETAPVAAFGELPALSELDALREASQLKLSELDGIQTLARSDQASEIGNYLRIDAGEDISAWGLYSLDAQDGFLISLDVTEISESDSEYWIGVSDYEKSRWAWSGPHSVDHSLVFDDSGYISPAGTVYAAIVVASGNAVRVKHLTLKVNSNGTPVADLQPAFRLGRAPLTVEFNTGYSNEGDDPGDSIVEYAWDWDGDGTYEQVGTNPAPAHIYTVVGDYHPVLRVTDSKGLSATDSGTVICLAQSTYETQSIQGGPFYVSNPSITVLNNGCPAVAFSGGAKPYPQYVRATKKDISSWALPVVLGSFGGECAIAVVDGMPAVTLIESGKLYYERAIDELGSEWMSPVDMFKNDVFAETISICDVDGLPAVAYGGNDGGLSYTRALDSSGANWPSQSPDVGSANASTLTMVNGVPAVSGGLGSGVLFRQAQDISGQAWDTSQVVNKSGFDCALAVISGFPAVVYSSSADGMDKELFYARALDVDGIAWGLPIDLQVSGTNPSLAAVNGKPAVSYYMESTITLGFMIGMDAAGSAWSAPEDIGKGSPSSKLVEVDARPLVCYSTPVDAGEGDEPFQIRFTWGF